MIDAVTYTPRIKGALLELIDVLYQLDDLQEAKKYIDIAEKEGIRPAQSAYLKGLTLVKEGNNPEAIDVFKSAKELDTSLTQMADYQIGMAYLKEKKYGDAKDVFKEIVVRDPNSDMADYANRYIDALDRKAEAEKPFKFAVGAAFEYDDNVILKPSDAQSSSDVSNEDDTREVVTLRAEYNKKLAEKFGAKLQYNLYWANQDHLKEYDILSNSASITPYYNFEKASVSVPVGYNRTLVDDHDYLGAWTVNPMLNVLLGGPFMGQVFAKYQNKDFLRSALNDDEDRDSNVWGGGAGLFWFFMENKGFLNARYEFNNENAKGNNWKYNGNRFNATVLVPVVDKLKISAAADAYLQDFTKTHTIFNEKRHDNIYTASAMLSYEIIKDGEIQLKYTHITDDSNIAVYEYDRNIYSAGFEYRF